MRENISLEEAEQLLLDHCKVYNTESVLLSDALGRVLAEDVVAGENIPPFDRTPLDGYAMAAKDTEGASVEHPISLRVIEEVPAGYTATQGITTGTTIKVMTGAPIPEGADAIIKFEAVERQGDKISLQRGLHSGENIIWGGEDVRIGQIVAQRGMIITPPIMGLCAALGISKLTVYEQPQIALVSTGDELVDVTEPLQPGQIRNSNSYSLQGYCTQEGAIPVVIGTVKDEVDAIVAMIERGLEQANMVITTGGASVGDYDVIADALQALGAEMIFRRINVKPGMPTMAAVKDGKVILGLSGNPAASLIVYQLLGIPFIRKLAGRKEYQLPKLEAIVRDQFRKASPQRRFLRGKLILEHGQIAVDLTGSQGNGILSSMVGCNVLVEVPAGSPALMGGERLVAYLVEQIG